MIRLKLTSIGSVDGERTFSIIPGEKLDATVKRCLVGIELGGFKVDRVFQVLVNGHKIDSDFWPYTITSEGDTILLAPIIKGDNEGAIFRQLLVIGAIYATGGLLGAAGAFGVAGLGLSPFIVAAGQVAASIAFGMIANALIPPPVPDAGGLGAGGSNFSDSQMYSFSGQSNQVRKFGTVPKVYGTHRIFPPVAANPYTELEVDPDTGQQAQYLYAVYDLGLGPMTVDQFKIGDTAIEDYSDVQINLVDFNKPAVSEGTWDDVLVNDLQFYKGDVEQDNVSIVLNANQSGGGPQDGYEVIRNSALNTDGSPQAITLTFANPSGLISYSSTGNPGTASIDLDIYFSKVGEDVWRPFNGADFVDSYRSVGGDSILQNLTALAGPATTSTGDSYYSILQQFPPLQTTYYDNFLNPNFSYTLRRQVGLPIGTTQLKIFSTPTTLAELAPGRIIYITGTRRALGTIASVVPDGDPSYLLVTLQAPTTFPFIAAVYENKVWNGNVYLLVNGGDTLEVERKVSGRVRITRQEPQAAYSTVSFTPKNADQYKVRITRVSSTSQYTSQVASALSLVGLSTRFDRTPIITDKRHVFVEMRIRATNQLSGTIANLSAVCTSVLPVWDGTTWTKMPTRNPAWVFADLMTGQVNKRAIAVSRLHLPSLLEWANFCDEVPTSPPSITYFMPRFESNFVLDYDTTLQGVIAQVAGSSQASLNVVDGKYGVLVDKLKTIPVQVFTPRNSRGFTSTRGYAKRPDALRIKYIDPGIGWDVAEMTVYDDGFDDTTAVEFDDLSTFACTNTEQAWRFGRYMMAQNRLRQEQISIEVDFEHLVCTRGDFVQITQDTMRVGGFPARVTSISGNQITIDDGLDLPGGSYGFVYRSGTGSIETNTLSIVNANTFDLDGPEMPAVGDLIVIGEVGQIVYNCIVKAIAPNEDMTATIQLVEKADAIYSAESLTTFPAYDPVLSTTTSPDLAPPGPVVGLAVTDNFWNCSGSGYEYYIDLVWSPPVGSAYEAFKIYVDSGNGFNDVATTRTASYTYIVDPLRLGFEHSFKVVAISASGRKLDLGSVLSVEATPIRKITAPSSVDRLSTDITGEVLQLSWDRILDCDCQEYLIRYSVSTSGTWESSVPLLRVDRNSNLASTQARSGTYLIKAVDFNGNESAAAAAAITTIPNLFGLNIISETTDFPTLSGAFDRTEKSGDALVLSNAIVGGIETAEYYSEGFYYYQDLLDLGEIYTVRLQSLIQVEGFTAEDVMSNWVTLDSVLLLANSRFSEWDVQSQYRSTDTFNVMSEWVSLDLIDPINEGVDDNFTPWRNFVMGDATGRIFQFRLRLISNKPSVTPRVFDGTIRADMPDRVESYNNLPADDVNGYTLNYTPAFKGPGTTPNIQVSIEDAESGDYWSFDYRTLDGFKVRVFDKTDTQVSRTIDVAVKGFGRKAAAVI